MKAFARPTPVSPLAHGVYVSAIQYSLSRHRGQPSLLINFDAIGEDGKTVLTTSAVNWTDAEAIRAVLGAPAEEQLAKAEEILVGRMGG